MQLMQMIEQHVEKHAVPVWWPDDAQYAVVYCYCTWPVGWDRGDNRVVFFPTLTKFEEWLESTREWAAQEDNDFAYQAYRWDLGPLLVNEYQRNIEHL